MRHHASSTSVILGSFAFNSGHHQVIRSKEEINTPVKVNFLILIADIINVSIIIGSQMAPSTKSQVIKGLSSDEMNQH